MVLVTFVICVICISLYRPQGVLTVINVLICEVVINTRVQVD